MTTRKKRAVAPSYRLKLYRDEDGVWMAEIPQVRGVRSEGRSIEEARRGAREALGLADDQGVTEAMAAAAILVEDIELPDDQRAALEEARAARARADEAEAAAVAAQSEAVRRLHIDGGLSVRDVGDLLGVSGAMVHKRAKALVSAHGAKTRSKAVATSHGTGEVVAHDRGGRRGEGGALVKTISGNGAAKGRPRGKASR